jgi:hypothetical protein
MLKIFKQIPEPLQKQILYRLGYGITILVLATMLLIHTMEWFSVLACTGIMIFCIISAFLLFRRAVTGEYVVIYGECLAVTFTMIKRQAKMITLKTEDNRIIKVMIKQKLKKISAGSKIIMYVASNMQVYENGGYHLLNSYLLLDVKKS